MQNRRSLDPELRTLYGASLKPPVGYTFDGGVATTFSLDFETALAVPVSLVLFASENREDLLKNPLALLEGIERISSRLVVFAHAGRIQAHHGRYPRLCSLLESIIVEVTAPKGGAFHPKLWVIRYVPKLKDDPVRMRLLVLSRNLTRDRSWDLALVLDGTVGKRTPAANKPLVELLNRLPESDIPIVPAPEATRALVADVAESLRHTEWELPEHFESVEFAVNGLGGKPWRPERCSRLGVVSPFCDNDALTMLAALAPEKTTDLIARPDELALINADVIEKFAQVKVMDDVAITEDGEEADDSGLQGLHAKAFVAERGWDVSITVGSGNATKPALISGANIEVFATLTGKRSKIGSVEDILGEKGFGRLTRPYITGELAAPDATAVSAERRLDALRNVLCRAGMRLRCERAVDGETEERAWRLWLAPSDGLPLEGLAALRVWPITRGEGHARDALQSLREGKSLDLGIMPLMDLTRFLAMELTDKATGTCMLFSTGLAIDGLPADRHAAILKSIIDSKDSFFRYLRLLLSDMDDPFGAAVAAQEGKGTWSTGYDDMPILEELVRSFCQGGDQLKAVDRLISRLDAVEEGGADPVPPEFRSMWDTFRLAIDARKALHGE